MLLHPSATSARRNLSYRAHHVVRRLISNQSTDVNSKVIYLSKHFAPSLRAEAVGDDLPKSVTLLLRGGFIRQSSAGFFTLLPNGFRIVKKIEQMIDEEMTSIGASRIEMPTMLHSSLWHKTGRYETIGSELYKLKDRKGTEFILAPTFEEEVTKLVGDEVQSYKQLPIKVYQITNKHRDEPRPRSGLLRTRGFVMKDLYSFDASVEEAERTYEQVRSAYDRIMNRLFGKKGEGWQVAEADTGAMGGLRSHEYQVQDPLGEDELISCEHCDYSANIEKATSLPSQKYLPIEASEVHVSLHGSSDPASHSCVLTAVIYPRSRPLNTIKLTSAVESKRTGQAAFSADQLFTTASSDSNASSAHTWDWKDRPEGPLIRFERINVLLDHECAALEEEEIHQAILNAVEQFGSPPVSEKVKSSDRLEGAPVLSDYFSSQFHSASETLPYEFVDVRQAEQNDACPSCRTGKLLQTKTVEVGHTFLLGTRYSKALNYHFEPQMKGKDGPAAFQMGCYGIGLTRILGVLAQIASRRFDRLIADDEEKVKKRAGFAWNPETAPFRALIIAQDISNDKQVSAIQKICSQLIGTQNSSPNNKVFDELIQTTGPIQESDVAIDDRATMSIGAKLNEADLVGYPIVFILGKYFNAKGEVEVRYKSDDGVERIVHLPL